MTANGVFQLVLYVVVLLALAKPLGGYMARVYAGEGTALTRVLGPVERLVYRLAGVRAEDEMPWRGYAVAMLLFNGSAAVGTYLFAVLMVAILIAVTGETPAATASLRIESMWPRSSRSSSSSTSSSTWSRSVSSTRASPSSAS